MSKRADIIQLCKEYLKQTFSRGDYKELVVLTLLYLQDEDTVTAFKKFYRPLALRMVDGKVAVCHKNGSPWINHTA